MKFTASIITFATVGRLLNSVAALDYTIGIDPTIATDFTVATPTVTSTYTTGGDATIVYAENFYAAPDATTCTVATTVPYVGTGTEDKATAGQLVLASLISDLDAAETAGTIRYCHEVVSQLAGGTIMFKRQTVITITIDLTGAFTATAIDVTENVPGASAGADTVASTMNAVASPTTVTAGTSFTVTVSNTSPAVDVDEITTFLLGGLSAIATSAVETAFTNYIPTPVCAAGSCTIIITLPYTYFDPTVTPSATLTLTGTATVSAAGVRRLLSSERNTEEVEGDKPFALEIDLTGLEEDESESSAFALGGALLAVNAVMVFL